MLDIKFIRDYPGLIKEACKKKKINFDVDYFLEVDRKRKELMKSIEELNTIKNQANKRIQLAENEEARKTIIFQMRELDINSDNQNQVFKKLDEEYKRLMLLVPNIPDETVPVGDSDLDNVEIRKWGKIPSFNFLVKDHIQIAKDLDLIDFEKGSEVAGFRGYFLKREAALI